MALKNSKTLKNGAVAEYHNIVAINLSTERIKNGENSGKRVNIIVNSYASEDYRKADMMNALDRECYSFEVTNEELDRNIYSLCYNYLKTTEEFKDAVDC
jgi:hypothetical protein